MLVYGVPLLEELEVTDMDGNRSIDIFKVSFDRGVTEVNGNPRRIKLANALFVVHDPLFCWTIA